MSFPAQGASSLANGALVDTKPVLQADNNGASGLNQLVHSISSTIESIQEMLDEVDDIEYATRHVQGDEDGKIPPYGYFNTASLQRVVEILVDVVKQRMDSWKSDTPHDSKWLDDTYSIASAIDIAGEYGPESSAEFAAWEPQKMFQVAAKFIIRAMGCPDNAETSITEQLKACFQLDIEKIRGPNKEKKKGWIAKLDQKWPMWKMHFANITPSKKGKGMPIGWFAKLSMLSERYEDGWPGCQRLWHECVATMHMRAGQHPEKHTYWDEEVGTRQVLLEADLDDIIAGEIP